MPDELLGRLDSYAQLDEILAHDKILNDLQEERLQKARAQAKSQPKKK